MTANTRLRCHRSNMDGPTIVNAIMSNTQEKGLESASYAILLILSLPTCSANNLNYYSS